MAMAAATTKNLMTWLLSDEFLKLDDSSVVVQEGDEDGMCAAERSLANHVMQQILAGTTDPAATLLPAGPGAGQAKETKLNTGPWSLRENFALVSAVELFCGVQNWPAISETLIERGFTEPGRPADWFSPQNCAVQYEILIEQYGELLPPEVAGETKGQRAERYFRQEYKTQLEFELLQDELQMEQLKADIADLKSGECSEEDLARYQEQLFTDLKKMLADERKAANGGEEPTPTAHASTSTASGQDLGTIVPVPIGSSESSESKPSTSASAVMSSKMAEAVTMATPTILPISGSRRSRRRSRKNSSAQNVTATVGDEQTLSPRLPATEEEPTTTVTIVKIETEEEEPIKKTASEITPPTPVETSTQSQTEIKTKTGPQLNNENEVIESATIQISAAATEDQVVCVPETGNSADTEQNATSLPTIVVKVEAEDEVSTQSSQESGSEISPESHIQTQNEKVDPTQPPPTTTQKSAQDSNSKFNVDDAEERRQNSGELLLEENKSKESEAGSQESKFAPTGAEPEKLKLSLGPFVITKKNGNDHKEAPASSAAAMTTGTAKSTKALAAKVPAGVLEIAAPPPPMLVEIKEEEQDVLAEVIGEASGSGSSEEAKNSAPATEPSTLETRALAVAAAEKQNSELQIPTPTLLDKAENFNVLKIKIEQIEDESKSSSSHSPALSETSMKTDDKVFKKGIYLLHARIVGHKNASLFHKPIKEESTPGYHRKILRPMDLTTIKKRIDSGEISRIIGYERDIALMFLNAKVFNSNNDGLTKLTDEMAADVWELIDDYKSTQQLLQLSTHDENESNLESPILIRRTRARGSNTSVKSTTDSPSKPQQPARPSRRATRGRMSGLGKIETSRQSSEDSAASAAAAAEGDLGQGSTASAKVATSGSTKPTAGRRGSESSGGGAGKDLRTVAAKSAQVVVPLVDVSAATGFTPDQQRPPKLTAEEETKKRSENESESEEEDKTTEEKKSRVEIGVKRRHSAAAAAGEDQAEEENLANSDAEDEEVENSEEDEAPGPSKRAKMSEKISSSGRSTSTKSRQQSQSSSSKRGRGSGRARARGAKRH